MEGWRVLGVVLSEGSVAVHTQMHEREKKVQIQREKKKETERKRQRWTQNC